MYIIKILLLTLITGYLTYSSSRAQFIDHFDGPYDPSDPKTPEGWSYATGDGQAVMNFLQMDGFASALIDASNDKRNIWWALIRCQVTGLNMLELIQPENELRVEARIRVSHAPRRVNLHFNHQRTTDYHSHLMEYDIPDTVNWHTISMTTRDFETRQGDRINVQMALMDWGKEIYKVDIDYFKVDVVNKNTIGKDLGAKLPYHPTVADPHSFKYHLMVSQDATIDFEYPDMNFNDWKMRDEQGETTLLSVSGTQIVILQWDLEEYRGKQITGSGLLEITTHTLQRSAQYQKDFGMVRVVEVLGGDPDWDQEKVTFNSFSIGKSLGEVLNSQMIIDYEVKSHRGEKTLFTITQPVLQRMIDGRTLGFAIRPLGAVTASFYSMENNQGKYSARIHFDIE